MKERATQFINTHAMGVDAVDCDAILEAFLNEMTDGLSSTGSSMAMIPTFVNCSHAVPTETPVIVLDAGGTNLRVCTVTFHENDEPTLANFSKFKMPGIGHELGADEFYSTLLNFMNDIAPTSTKIGFCFSYPTEIFPNRDGRLIRWTKEVQIPELVGEFIGTGLLAKLKDAGHGDKEIVILNDTVAALLAGKTVGEKHKCSDYIGFILGTGTNTAYVERNAKITKRDDLDLAESMIVCLESGNFSKCPQGVIDIRFDSTTANPGKQTFEKMISGAYLGPLCLELLHAAAEDRLFSDSVNTLVRGWTELTTIDMDDFLGNPYRKAGAFYTTAIGEDDRELMIHLFTAIITRAALLTAINISGTVIKSGAGTSPLHPVCINIDGSTFYKTNNFPHKVLGHLDRILGDRGIYYMTVQIDNAPILGAAIAALS